MGSSRHKHPNPPNAPPNLSATLPRQSRSKPRKDFRKRKLPEPFRHVQHDYPLPATYSHEDHQYVRHKKARRGRLTADYDPGDHYQPQPVPPDEDDSESSPCQGEETCSDDDSDQGEALLSHAYFERRMQSLEEFVVVLSTQLRNLESKFSDFDNRLAAFGSKVESLAKNMDTFPERFSQTVVKAFLDRDIRVMQEGQDQMTPSRVDQAANSSESINNRGNGNWVDGGFVEYAGMSRMGQGSRDKKAGP